MARNEAPQWGHFRGEGAETEFTPDVALGQRGRFTPLPTVPGATQLKRVFLEGVQALEHEVSDPFERAMAFYFFGALQQFFFDGYRLDDKFGVFPASAEPAPGVPPVENDLEEERPVRPP